MKYLLCFGNPYLKEDNAVINIIKKIKLSKYKVIICTSPDEILLYAEKDFMIVDVAKGISKPIIIRDPKQLQTRSIVSLHDFDLNFFLKLYNQLGKKVKILAIPQITKKNTEQEIKNLLLEDEGELYH